MRNCTLIRRLLCAAMAIASQSPTLVRADAAAAVQPPPLHARVNSNPAPPPVGAGALGASLQLKGSPASVKLEARRTSVARALAALGTTYHISIRSTVVLDALRDGTYAGSLRHVIARLLDGYNYVIEENSAATLDVFVVGKSDGKATPAPTMPVVLQHRIPVTYRISGVRP
jgi:hypothetical protein